MEFDLQVKHSFSNKLNIKAWDKLDSEKMVSFDLSNGNIILFFQDELINKFELRQNIREVRKEIRKIIIDQLNADLNLVDVKISEISSAEDIIGGYHLPHYTDGKAYIRDVDGDIGEILFDRIDEQLGEKNNIGYIDLNLRILLGLCNVNLKKISVGDVYKFKSNFHIVCMGRIIFDFCLGIDELMAVKKGQGMSIEESIGESIITDEDLQLDVELSLGKIDMSISQLQELIVGDFIDIQELSFPNVDLILNNKKIATAELVYNENKELAIEIKEVLIK